MVAVQPIPDDEIAAELAGSWDPDDGPMPVVVPPAPVRPWRPSGPEDLVQAAMRARPVSLKGEHGLPVVGALQGVLPAGLPRGAVVSVDGSEAGGAVSLALALAAAPSAAGSWVALVGLPAVGLGAAAELGVSLERVVVVQTPPPEMWATAVGALVGAFDIVLVAAPGRVRGAEVRRLAARTRERGAVLVQLDDARRGAGRTAPERRGAGRTAPERRGAGEAGLLVTLRLRVTEQRWQGVGEGHGYLRSRWVRVELDGRRHAARPRRADLWLPDESGRVRSVEPVTPPDGHRENPDVPDVRRARIRRVARHPLPAPVPSAADDDGHPASSIWSDAG